MIYCVLRMETSCAIPNSLFSFFFLGGFRPTLLMTELQFTRSVYDSVGFSRGPTVDRIATGSAPQALMLTFDINRTRYPRFFLLSKINDTRCLHVLGCWRLSPLWRAPRPTHRGAGPRWRSRGAGTGSTRSPGAPTARAVSARGNPNPTRHS